MELKYTARGPRLIEVNCRMGGGPVRLTNLLVWGVDLVEEHLLTTAGIPSRPPVRSSMQAFSKPAGHQKAFPILRVQFCRPTAVLLVFRPLHHNAADVMLRFCPSPPAPCHAQVAVRPLAHIAEYSVNAHKSGIIKHVDYLKVRVAEICARSPALGSLGARHDI